MDKATRTILSKKNKWTQETQNAQKPRLIQDFQPLQVYEESPGHPWRSSLSAQEGRLPLIHHNFSSLIGVVKGQGDEFWYEPAENERSHNEPIGKILLHFWQILRDNDIEPWDDVRRQCIFRVGEGILQGVSNCNSRIIVNESEGCGVEQLWIVVDGGVEVDELAPEWTLIRIIQECLQRERFSCDRLRLWKVLC